MLGHSIHLPDGVSLPISPWQEGGLRCFLPQKAACDGAAVFRFLPEREVAGSWAGRGVSGIKLKGGTGGIESLSGILPIRA